MNNHENKRFLVFFLLLFSICCMGYAQQISVSGVVTSSDDGIPMPGVNVVMKGTSNGVVSDIDGNYSINVDGESVLVFSYLGFSTQEITVDQRTTIDASMTENVQALDDVVVVGYGSVKRSDITGSISSVKSEDLATLPTQRIDQALQGRAAGVMVMNTDASPGGNTRIRIRGMNSILGGNDALIVIDGLQGGDLNLLNPNDVESVEILKDASATAIYGSRGANGVILVTTKKGKKGKPVFSYSYSYGFQNLRKKLQLLGPAEYARNVNAFLATRNDAGPVTPTFSDAEITRLETTEGTDWQDEIFRVAPISNHQLSVSGGGDNVSYYFSGGYLDQKGILENSDFQRLNIRATIDSKVTEWFEAGLRTNFTRTVGSVSPFGGNLGWQSNAVLNASRWGANLSVFDENGEYTRHPTGGYGPQETWNPVAEVQEVDTKNNRIDNNIVANLKFKILNGLSLLVTGTANFSTNNPSTYYNQNTRLGTPVNGLVGFGFLSNNYFQSFQNSNTLSYKKEFGKHSFELTALAEQQSTRISSNAINASQFTVDATGLNDLAGAAQVTVSSTTNKRVLNSYMGRLNYNYSGKYLITATYRADGSSVFGNNNKWGYFPSLALGWRVSEENFIKNNADWISNLKLRGSYGTTGNQAIGPYNTLAAISSSPNAFFNYPYNGLETTDLGLRITRAANPDLKWESTVQRNIGLDIGLFNGRLTSTIDVYSKKTEDLLLDRSLPGYTGLFSVIRNVGSIENKGLEISIAGDPLTGNFKWNTAFNISWNENRILDLGGSDRIKFRSSLGGYGVNDLTFLEEGGQFADWFGYKSLGVWSEDQRAEAAEFGQLPGMERYQDTNGDGQIDTEDITVIGNALPDYIYGWSNKFSFKNFDLNIMLQGTYGNEVFNQGRIRLETFGVGNSIRLLDRWSINNQDTDIPALIDTQTVIDSGLESRVALGESPNATSRFVEDGSYLRLQNITLGYNVPKFITTQLGLTNFRAFISATNLITWTSYTGYDPEVSSFNGNDAQLGIDLGNYPSAKTVTWGLDIKF